MIIQTLTTSFKTELLQGIHDFSTDTFKIALYSSTADLSADTTEYTSTGETTGTPTNTLAASIECQLNFYGTGDAEALLATTTDVYPTGVAVGQLVTGDYIPSNTYVTSITQFFDQNPYVWLIGLSNPVTTSQYNPILYTTASFYNLEGYTAGGNTLTVVGPSYDGTTAYVNFDNTSWASAFFTTAGALIYNSSKSNKSVAVLNFGNTKTATGTFTVQFPAATASTAIIRIA